LDNLKNSNQLVAVIGAGPAGLFATKQLAAAGVHVLLFNRDIKPGGLAEYGIYPRQAQDEGGAAQAVPPNPGSAQIEYFGNVIVGQKGDLTLPELTRLGFQALLSPLERRAQSGSACLARTCRASTTPRTWSTTTTICRPTVCAGFAIGKRVAVIGVGNVMVDIAHWLVRDLKVDEVIAVARRGPAEVKFTKKEMESWPATSTWQDLDAEIERVSQGHARCWAGPTAGKGPTSCLPAQGACEPVSTPASVSSSWLQPHRIWEVSEAASCAAWRSRTPPW
jgi:ferredoxin/flavodoxin---NADP+ reductase